MNRFFWNLSFLLLVSANSHSFEQSKEPNKEQNKGPFDCNQVVVETKKKAELCLNMDKYHDRKVCFTKVCQSVSNERSNGCGKDITALQFEMMSRENKKFPNIRSSDDEYYKKYQMKKKITPQKRKT